MDFEPNNIPPCYKTVDESIVIKQDDEVCCEKFFKLKEKCNVIFLGNYNFGIIQ
jgi:hypothetical protein